MESAQDGFDTAHTRALLRARMFGAPSQPTRIGRYSILRCVGSGGMGIVYAAYDEDIDRKVAIKLVRADAPGDKSAIAERVRREAQALGRLSHPNIVAVHEVGEHVAADGTELVFIAMEFVRGATLRQFCSERERPWQELLEVVVQAGRGLAAVHAAGLVHRDVKPDNVMIDDEGDGARVRLMDFGLARVDLAADEITLERSGNDDPLATPAVTRSGALIGTPAYMALEQLDGGAVGPAADQFAWCVMTWEALFGERPFAGADLASLVTEVRAGRCREPRALRGVPLRIRRVLERGLAPRSEDRWPDVATMLAALALPRRRPVLAIAGIAVAAVASVLVLQREDPEAPCRARADELASVWSAPARAQVETAMLASGLGFAAESWTRVDAQIAGWIDEATTVELAACRPEAKGWSDRLQTARLACMADRRRALTALVDVLGNVAGDDAKPAVTRAVQAVARLPRPDRCSDVEYLSARVEPPSDPDTAAAVDRLREQASRIEALASAGAYGMAHDEAVAMVESARATGYGPLVAHALMLRGRGEQNRGRFAEAELSARAAHAEAIADGDDELAARVASQLVYVVGYRQGRHLQGLEWAVHARASLRRVGEPPQIEAVLSSALGNVEEARGHYDEALAHHERALALQERVLPEDHPDVADSINNIGLVSARRGELEPARVAIERAAAMYERALGPDHPDVGDALNNLGIVHEQAGRYPESLAVHRRALAIRERAFGPDNPEVAVSLNNLGTLHIRTGEYDEARAELTRGLAIVIARLGAEHRMVAEIQTNLGWIDDTRGDYASALEHYRVALAVDEHNFGDHHPETAYTLDNMAIAYERMHDYAQARRHYERALAIREAAVGPDHPDVADTLIGLANVANGLGEHAEAMRLFERALAVTTAALGSEHGDNATALGGLGKVYRATHDYDRSLAAFDRALRLRSALLGADHPRVAWLHEEKGETLLARGDLDAAVGELEEALRVRSGPGIPPADLADTRFALARALARRDPQRAHTLATQARAAYGALPHRADALPAVDALLADVAHDLR